MSEQLTLDLFATMPAAVPQGDVDIAMGGLGHFRAQMARYALAWPYLVPEWQAWIAYFERMRRDGYEAAQCVKPRNEESEPSQMFAALTRRLNVELSGHQRPARKDEDGTD